MARKKTSAPRKAAPAPPESGGKVRFEVRFDEDVYEAVKKLSDHAAISVNQLMHALARWASQNYQLGEPYRDEGGHLKSRAQPGCVWFGKPAEAPRPPHEWEEMAAVYGGKPNDYNEWTDGNLVFALDFTERRVLRDEDDSSHLQSGRNPGQRPKGSR